jgi:oligopeptide/dipeptide ABC transporter ATP-binding protein
MTQVLEVENIYKTFPVAGSRAVVRAVNGVSFTVRHGETVALVGESGSGKTTVGRCMLGLAEVDSGTIRFNGKDITKRRARRDAALYGKIQLVFQEPAESLDPRYRIGRAILEPLDRLRLDAAERHRRLSEVVERVGLTPAVLQQYPTELSAGQQQRVGIARAIITNPALVILDEPTSALDPTARAEIIDLLMAIQKQSGTSYIFISHDLSTVRFISHRVAVMYLGMIVEQGNSAELFARPHHPYSVGLLSAVLLPNPRLKRLTSVSLEGEIPSPINLPTGCFLASRCPFADDGCRSRMPPAEDVGAGHLVHCFKHAEVAAVDRSIDTFDEFQREAEQILGAGFAPEPDAISRTAR